MSSTEPRTERPRLRIVLAALLVGAVCLSSLSFASQAEAQAQTLDVEPVVVDGTNVHVAVVGAVFAGYGWLAAKSYDLGKEVGKSMVGSTDMAEDHALTDPSIEYLLD